jgi:uncharacterized protein YbjT (DUF2867 family)
LGRLVATRLTSSGYEVRILSRRAGAGTHTGDLATGEGLAPAVSGAQVIVHVASDTRRLGRSDAAQTKHLLEHAGGAAHLVYISIVGIDRIPFAYYRHKLACEQLIHSSGIPFTVLRATQFHELLALGLDRAERLPVAPLPLDFRFQSVAAAEVAERLSQLVSDGPTNRTLNMGGPAVLSLREIVGQWQGIRSRPRRVIRLALPGAVARAFREGRNTCPDHAEGEQTWQAFVEQSSGPAHSASAGPRR